VFPWISQPQAALKAGFQHSNPVGSTGCVPVTSQSHIASHQLFPTLGNIVVLVLEDNNFKKTFEKCITIVII
jgi:hypothetical protein